MADTPENGTNFKGVFKPPIFSFSGGKPIKIAGPGQCRLTEEGLVISGFKRKWPQHAKVLLGLGLSLLVAILALVAPLLGSSDGDDSAVWILALIGPLLLIVLPLIRGYDEHNNEKPLEYTLSWDRIRSVRRGRVSVAIDVAKGRPRGFLYFEPKGETQPLVKAIRERIRKPQE